MTMYRDMSLAERQEEALSLKRRLDEIQALGLDLNMARGKPAPAQLDYVDRCFAEIDPAVHDNREGVDCRNYGELYGIIEMREIFAEMLKTEVERVWCLSASSLTIMYDLLSRLRLFPLPGQKEPWPGDHKISFLCPVPGYDRHFTMCETLGINMIPIEIEDGAIDMDEVERICAEDPSVKGIWLVPMYSNPDGTTYSEALIRRLLRMKAASDFRIFADMAYCAHHLNEKGEPRAEVLPLLKMAEEEGQPERIFVFASTSKITYAGGGVACLAASEKNQAWMKPSLSAQMISANKMNMLRHVQVIQKQGGIDAMMKEHRRILRRKFEAALSVMDKDLAPYGIAKWQKPLGGYFIAVRLYPGTAAAVVKRCKEAGVVLTAAGATYPYGKDPLDRTLRIAPSFPETDELEEAIKIFCLAARYEALNKMNEE